MNYNHRCAITGDEVAVEACHIQTHANYFDNSLDNGVLLSVGLHRLFDAGIMIICPETMTISFTRNCYKKYLDGALVKQGRIPISKKNFPRRTQELKFAMRLRRACETLSRSRMVITLAADVYLPSQKCWHNS
ncbi:HNH endonuclease [Klebsiella pneumoniae subsp. pneumoniae]|uniref:HNH endonuclease n=1 Tax=Klebsiella pneumoniae subsp. pneumoniae TaxID=72407 RepID=A0A7S9E0X8_KLEPN|nr:HNH endonuclease [Klebsiella pneumoniae subsp. pneumoniae]